jgi:hypothetical protein
LELLRAINVFLGLSILKLTWSWNLDHRIHDLKTHLYLSLSHLVLVIVMLSISFSFYQSFMYFHRLNSISIINLFELFYKDKT